MTTATNSAAPPRPVRILIVDDHPAVREALRMRISRHEDLEVCGEAVDVADALEVLARTQPDVAIVDIALKTGDGIDLIKRIKARNDHVRILVWSMYREALYAQRALRAGALGYIDKEQATDKIIDAIRAILAGNIYLSPTMTNSLLQRAVGDEPAHVLAAPTEVLSDRELEVFRAIGAGQKVQQIATQLHLSVKTVETYRDRIRGKLGLSDAAELARRAFQWVLENG